MPGRLMMDMEAKDPLPTGILKRDGSHLSQPSDGPEQKRVAIAEHTLSPRLNGAKPMTAPNGAHFDQHSTNGFKSDAKEDGEPPEIEQFRDTLVPFGRMLERMAQQTYFDLTELVEALADLPVQQQQQMANGVGTQTIPDKSAVSVDKKLRLLNFAQTHKDRYIKALVLSDWARNMDDMAKLIDVSMCLRKHDWSTIAAADSIYRLKENMVGAKMPNPNIEGALELLSSGQTTWMPEMSVYIPQKPLSASELLDTLSDMNFALSMRLNLHEALPKHMSDYTIANGRVTFTVPDEFEVDLAIADNETDSPFYFIDLRLIFNPPISLNQDRLRNQLEAQVNTILASSGLLGCYRFLHNFVLTHKLNMLRCQALDLARGKWIDNIEVQSVHRAVIVHYWTDLPGGKNWIELGITSGEGDKTAVPSRIACRWFRRGKEVLHHDLNLDFSNPSVEKILDHVIALHAGGRLTVIHDGLDELSRGTRTFEQLLKTSPDTAVECSLAVVLRPLVTPITIMIDPVRGTFCALPGDNDGSDTERRLNLDDQVDIPIVIRNTLCHAVMRRISEQAPSVGLTRVPIEVQPGTASPFPSSVVAHRSFRISKNASQGSQVSAKPQSFLTATADLASGLTWYISETATSRDGGVYIRSAVPLDLAEPSDKIDRQSLIDISGAASKMVSLSTLSRELNLQQTPFVPAGGNISSTSLPDKVLLKPAHMAISFSAMKPLFAEIASFSLEKDGSYLFRTFLRKGIRRTLVDQLCESLSGKKDMILTADGELSIVIRPTPGLPVLGLLQTHLRDIARLYELIEIISSRKLTLIRATLAEISFTYSKGMSCTIKLDATSETPLLRFGTTPDQASETMNPHDRIRQQLEDTFVKPDPSAQVPGIDATKFLALCASLDGTLPIVERMQVLETTDPVSNVLLMCRSPTSFKLVYKDPFPELSIRIIAQHRKGQFVWVARLAEVKNLGPLTRKGLGDLWSNKGEGWQGLKTGVVATVEGMKDLLDQIHEMLAKHKGEVSAAETVTAAPAPAAAAKSAPSGKSANEAVVLD